ncbi:hypothetical protein V8F33_005425 [Rhypophila sp. PSN 637]
MLSRNSPALSSDLPPAQHPSAIALRESANHNTVLDGYVSPRELERARQLQHRVSNSISTPPSRGLSPLAEYHSGYTDAEPGSCSYNSKQHRRQQSFPNLLPLARGSRTPSPTRKLGFLPEQMPFTGDGRGGNRPDSPKGGFAGWLSGMSSNPAVPSSASSRGTTTTVENTGVSSTAENTPTRSNRSTSNTTVTSTAASRFMSVISRFNQGNNNAPSAVRLDDELCDLDIEAALFPPMSPLSDRDTFSPAAFKNFQINAVGLLNRFQNAYRERTVTVREMQAKRSAQADEMEEAETRAQHLKMQLEGMARKAQEQESVMKQLMEELAAERRARANEQRRFAALMAGDKSPVVMSEGGSMVSEDLGVDEDRLRLRMQKKDWRVSSGSMMSLGNGLNDETDEESAESESVFSRCRSPPNASSLSASSSIKQQHVPQQQKTAGGNGGVSTLAKIIRGISGENEEPVSECENCKGQDASVAWDTVSLLRDENRHLKSRVGQLEVAVEGALDLVNGIGL